MKRLIFTVVALLGYALSAQTVLAEQPWSLFGNAQSVKKGLKPNPWAVELVSFSYLVTPNYYGGVAFAPRKGTTFADIASLGTSYMLTQGTFGGGSPRFEIGIDRDGDGDADGNVFVYLGTGPAFTDAPVGWQDTGNFIGTPAGDLRYDTSQVGGTFYSNYSTALALVGDDTVVSVDLVLDGGWASPGGVQTLLVDNVRVNNFKLTANGSSKK